MKGKWKMAEFSSQYYIDFDWGPIIPVITAMFFDIFWHIIKHLIYPQEQQIPVLNI